MSLEEGIKIWRLSQIMSKKFPKNALIPYITFGDPYQSFTEKLIQCALDNGADVIELGIPFSDPIADGAVIQASHQRALQNDPDISLISALKMVKKFKEKTTTPFVFMAAVNLILQFGIQDFFEKAQSHHLDAIIIPDLPVEEAAVFLQFSKQYNVDLVLLISPLCTKERLKKIVSNTSGFLYLISSTGTTGVRQLSTHNLKDIIKQCHAINDIPIYVGFGVSAPAHVKDIHKIAQGAIVGSYLMNILETHLQDLELALVQIGSAIRTLKES